MLDINKIEISIINLDKNINIIIDTNNLKYYCNNIVKDINKEKIKELIKIITFWDKKYINNSIIDSEECIVKVYTLNNIDTYEIKGYKPKYYDVFKEIVGELYG